MPVDEKKYWPIPALRLEDVELHVAIESRMMMHHHEASVPSVSCPLLSISRSASTCVSAGMVTGRTHQSDGARRNGRSARSARKPSRGE